MNKNKYLPVIINALFSVIAIFVLTACPSGASTNPTETVNGQSIAQSTTAVGSTTLTTPVTSGSFYPVNYGTGGVWYYFWSSAALGATRLGQVYITPSNNNQLVPIPSWTTGTTANAASWGFYQL